MIVFVRSFFAEERSEILDRVYDAIVIGAGVTGCSIAYHLSRYQGNFLVLEEQGDVGEGTSKANSGIAHGGYDAVPGSMKAIMNRAGMDRMEELSKELDFSYKKIGSLVLCHSEAERSRLERLYQQGIENHTPGLRIVERDELLQMEPNAADDVVAALYCSEAGIVDPFEMTIAFAEQANVNGVAFKFFQKVIGIVRTEEGWRCTTQNDTYVARAIINAAGLFSDRIHNMVSDSYRSIYPRKGEYMLLDRDAFGIVNHVIFDLPSDKGKGVLVAPTTHDNILLGPTAEFISDKRQLETTKKDLDRIRERTAEMIQAIPYHQVITSFTGLRAHDKGDDFILEESEENFFDCIGVESPGLSSAPAIGKYMADLAQKKLRLPENSNFKSKRKGITHTRELPREELKKLIQKNPDYAQIICRCERVTEAEILEAIHRPIGAKTLDGLKRRVRATSGRCQGGFCMPHLIDILARELQVEKEEITKRGMNAYLLTGRTK